jgi:hypothetical protein
VRKYEDVEQGSVPVRAMVRRSRMEREVDMELRFHMEALAEGLGAPRRASRRSTAAGTHRVWRQGAR